MLVNFLQWAQRPSQTLIWLCPRQGGISPNPLSPEWIWVHMGENRHLLSQIFFFQWLWQADSWPSHIHNPRPSGSWGCVLPPACWSTHLDCRDTRFSNRPVTIEVSCHLRPWGPTVHPLSDIPILGERAGICFSKQLQGISIYGTFRLPGNLFFLQLCEPQT